VRRRHFLSLLAGAVGAVACRRRPEFRVGSKDTVEQVLLGEILAAWLERRFGAGSVARHLALGTSAFVHEAMQAGQIDLYVEYLGIGLCDRLDLPPIADLASARDQVSRNYRIQFRFEWLGSLGFSNPPVCLIRRDRAARGSLKTLADAVRDREPWVLGITKEYERRRDGLPLLLKAYSLRLAGPPQNLPASTMLDAVQSRQISLAVVDLTEPALAGGSGEFAILEDDAHAFPPYDASIVVRIDTLDLHPELLPALKLLEGRISLGTMRRLRRRVQVESARPAAVAQAFVASLS
jgi:glycine betaine/choline ABC-type transport system substrate-binding protein